MGQRDLRRLMITGAMAVISWAVRRGETSDPWLVRMLARKPRMLVAVTLANKMARIVNEEGELPGSHHRLTGRRSSGSRRGVGRSEDE